MSDLTHVDQQGKASMVDVSDKQVTERTARAESVVEMSPSTLALIKNNNIKKGDVLSVARVAGIQAAKRCADLIPLCHPMMLTGIDINFHIDEQQSQLIVQCRCKVSHKTGVEMEALTGASVAALTIYDMCKGVEKGIIIRSTRLLEKQGGKSGQWHASN
ncbi:MAG: cyclic pyranopterin monophosphate synthase MoaC [Gammaproteobacteria bacterium]